MGTMGASLYESCDVGGTARRNSLSLSGQDFNTSVTVCQARRALVYSHLSIAATRWIALPPQNHRVTCGSTFQILGIGCKARKISQCCLFGLAQGRARCSSRVVLPTTQNIRSKATSTSSQLHGASPTILHRNGFLICLFASQIVSVSRMASGSMYWACPVGSKCKGRH